MYPANENPHISETNPTNEPLEPLEPNTENAKTKLNDILSQIAKEQLGIDQTSFWALLGEKEVDRMLGCLFGAFIGDALGSFCQFQSRVTCMGRAEMMMTMPGGGPFHLFPGQVTDDSEMALHMLRGLLTYNSKTPLEPQIPTILACIGREYVQWVQNIPFDIGFTCRTGIIQLQHHLSDLPQTLTPEHTKTLPEKLSLAHKAIQTANEKSLSNGFMMRLAPMACFASLIAQHRKEDIKALDALVKGENNMTHSNAICVSACQVYVQVIRAMILRDGHEDIVGVYRRIEEQFRNTAEENVVGSAIEEAFISHKNKDKDLCTADGRGAGFFKIALFYTFYSFRQIATNCKTEQDLTPALYKKLLKFTIEQGGDTDTNACIVGALAGAIIGFRNLPAEFLLKQFTLRLGNSPYRVNERMYEPVNGFVNLIKLIQKFR